MTSSAAESLLFAVLHRFEVETMTRYRAHVPELASPTKVDLIERLEARAQAGVALDESVLAEPIGTLLRAAQSTDEEETLLTQGLLLELLGSAIYRAAEESDHLPVESRELAARGRCACEASVSEAVRMISERIGRGEAAFEAFAAATHEVLSAVDDLAEPVDRVFAEPFGVRYAEVLGDCTADLLSTCQSLGMPRRKVAGHLASASMGF